MGTPAQLVGALRRLLTVVARPHARDRVEIERLAEEQAALRRVATLVAQGAPPPQVFEGVSAEVGRLLGADAAGLSRYETDGTATALGGWSRSGGQYLPGNRFSLEAPVIVDERLWGVLSVASTSDRPFPLDTEECLAEFAALVGTAIANAESREEVRQLAEEHAALRRVATLVAQGAAPASLLAVVAEEVARVVHVWFVSIARYEADGTATELANFSERGELFPVGTRWLLDGTNVLADVRESCRPARINDYSGLEGVIAQSVRRLGIRSTVGIPLVVAGRLWGAMVVSSAKPLPENTEARLADFTELVATAIANAESRAELDASRARIVATADETRRRIERDLHDGAQQRLISLALELRATLERVPAELQEHRAELARTVEGLTSVLDELREIARGIHPAILADGGLGPALKTLARRSALSVELDLRTELRLSERVEVAAYYVVSEALTNAAKYSQASVVHVTVEAGDQLLRVTVEDDGRGGADPERGSGLLGLKDRAEAIGGTMSLQSPLGRGTSLHVELPLEDAETRTAASGDPASLASATQSR